MTKTVKKYPLAGDLKQTIKMQGWPEILSVQVERGIPCLFVLVDDEDINDLERTFVILTTDSSFSEGLGYVATFQTSGGDFTWHLFEVEV